MPKRSANLSLRILLSSTQSASIKCDPDGAQLARDLTSPGSTLPKTGTVTAGGEGGHFRHFHRLLMPPEDPPVEWHSRQYENMFRSPLKSEVRGLRSKVYGPRSKRADT